jgi:hypothetical protein
MPTSIGAVPYGSVHFRESKYEFASTLGYAASVDAKSIDSDPDAVKSIAMDLVRYSLSNQIRVVNLPLLGSGAGGLTPRQSYESLKGVFVDADKITFNIFCFTREVVQNVIAASPQQTLTTETVRHPRVFISYTANKSEDREWVKNLAEKLRANGVDARIDIYHLKPGFDLPQWMTNEIILADKVLLVCNRAYMEKADFRKGGVGWETMIIQGDMLAQGDNKQKYIAIIRENEVETALPIHLKSKYALHWGSNPEIGAEPLNQLVSYLFDIDIEPDLGPVPDYVINNLTRKSGNKR